MSTALSNNEFLGSIEAISLSLFFLFLNILTLYLAVVEHSFSFELLEISMNMGYLPPILKSVMHNRLGEQWCQAHIVIIEH